VRDANKTTGLSSIKACHMHALDQMVTPFGIVSTFHHAHSESQISAFKFQLRRGEVGLADISTLNLDSRICFRLISA